MLALRVQDPTVPAIAQTACLTAAAYELICISLHHCCLSVCQARVQVNQHGLGLQGRGVPPAVNSTRANLPRPECERRGTTIRQPHSSTLARSGLTGAPASSLQCPIIANSLCGAPLCPELSYRLFRGPLESKHFAVHAGSGTGPATGSSLPDAAEQAAANQTERPEQSAVGAPLSVAAQQGLPAAEDRIQAAAANSTVTGQEAQVLGADGSAAQMGSMEPGVPGQAERAAKAPSVCKTPRALRPASHGSRTRRHSLALPYTQKMLAQVGAGDGQSGILQTVGVPSRHRFQLGVALMPFLLD